jgi:CheY-like chemotaxis protein
MKLRSPILNQPTVLLVEDEPLVRATQVDILQEAGFWVLEAQDADEAFEILKRRVGVKVVLTDVDMPGSLDGFEFSRLVAQGWPEVGVLVISGKAFPEEGDLPPSAVFLPKPVRPDALTAQDRSPVILEGGSVGQKGRRHDGSRSLLFRMNLDISEEGRTVSHAYR